MCKKSKLRVYKELSEDFECKKYLHGVSDIVLSFCSDLDLEPMVYELGGHSSRNSSKACFL